MALSAFDSFCRNAERGRFPQLADRDSLWRLLVVITARKAAHLVRDETRQKRGGGDRPVSEGSGDPDEESVWSRSSAGSRRPRWRPRWPRSIAACWTAWATRAGSGRRVADGGIHAWRRSPQKLGCVAALGQAQAGN